MFVTIMAATAAAAMPNLDGRRLRAGTSCFTIERDGKALGETLQSVRRRGRWKDCVDFPRAAGGCPPLSHG